MQTIETSFKIDPNQDIGMQICKAFNNASCLDENNILWKFNKAGEWVGKKAKVTVDKQWIWEEEEHAG